MPQTLLTKRLVKALYDAGFILLNNL